MAKSLWYCGRKRGGGDRERETRRWREEETVMERDKTKERQTRTKKEGLMTDKGRGRDKVERRNEGNKKKGERKIGCTCFGF